MTAIVPVVVRIGDAVVITVAPRAIVVVITLGLVAIGDAIAVAVPAARHVAPLLAAGDVEALPGARHVAIARALDHPLARDPDILVTNQLVVARRPDVAGPR